MKSWQVLRVRIILIAAVALAAMVGVWVVVAAPAPAGPPPTATRVPRYSPTMIAAKTAAAAEGARPRFYGELGDFEVVPDAGRLIIPCPAGESLEPVESPKVQQSEIYFSLPGFGFLPAAMCEGRAIGIGAEGPKVTIGRGYYSGPGKLKVGFHAPRDRLQLLTVGGHPAIAQLPFPEGLLSYVSVVVIQRHPTPSAPGIRATVNTDQGLDYAVSLLEQVLAQGAR